MAYATLAQVTDRLRDRTFTATSKPSEEDVGDYLQMTAAELDGILRAKGYQVPVDPSASSARQLLEDYNARGAVVMALAASQNDGGKLKGATEAWESAKKMLATGKVELDAARDTAQAGGRTGPSAATSRFADMGAGWC